MPYEKWDSAVTADIQCRFSSGQTPTWEEFWYWIEMIQKGIENHEHSGLGEGDGPLLHLSDLAGYATIEELQDVVDGIYIGLNIVVDGLEDVISVVASQGSALSSLSSAVSSILSTISWLEGEIDDLWTVSEAVVDVVETHSSNITAINLAIGDLSQGLANTQWAVYGLEGRIDDLESAVATAQARADDAYDYINEESSWVHGEIWDIWNSIQWIENNCCG